MCRFQTTILSAKLFLATLLRVQQFIDKDQPIKSLESMSRDKIFEAFDMYIKRCKSLIFGGESCDI